MKSLSIYIHIPFCKNICHYCNFLTFANKNKFIPDYLKALEKEISLKSSLYKDYCIETIYFGGGTPSLLESAQLQNILQTVRENFNLSATVEVSVECNPESIDEAKLEIYNRAGVTRISLGIQSFDKKTLFRIARPHDNETIFKALKSIKNSSFKNFGADFIIGLPYQTLQDFKTQVQEIVTFNIPHLSFYFLSYDTKRIDLFKADCPSEDIQVDMYEHLIKELKKSGYNHYEVSNYAKPGFECRHNMRYWEQQEYLGLGLGAHSYIDLKCFENEVDFDKYLNDPLLMHEEIKIDLELDKMEYIMLRLRSSNGINKQTYKKRFDDFDKLHNKAETFIQSGHLIEDFESLRPTEKGFLIVDKITRDLL